MYKQMNAFFFAPSLSLSIFESSSLLSLIFDFHVLFTIPTVLEVSVSWNRRYIKLRFVRAVKHWEVRRNGERMEAAKGETRGGRSFDNLGHAANRSGTDSIITVMLLKLRFFAPASRPEPRWAVPLLLPRPRPATVTLSSLINELRTKS